MNKLFVHHIWFRLLSPLFSGTLVYLLILLINDSVLSIQEDFFGQELYFCIILAYITQEFSRICLLIFEKLKKPNSFVARVFLQLTSSILLTISLVSICIYFYFKYILLYTPNFSELYIFNSIFSFITFLYALLYLGNYFLYRRNTKRITKEVQAKIAIETDFNSYTKEINPDLLFESLEAMLVTMKEDPNRAESLTDQFSTVYRYILSKRNKELVPLKEELEVLDELTKLFGHLPFRKVKIEKTVGNNPLLIPTSLLVLVESIIRSTIASEEKTLRIAITEEENCITLKYEPEERLTKKLSLKSISAIVHSYQFYSEIPIKIVLEGLFKIIKLPKLIYHEGSHT